MNFLSSLTIKHEKNSIAIFNLKIMKLMEYFFFHTALFLPLVKMKTFQSPKALF